jgi:hypothetical protein
MLFDTVVEQPEIVDPTGSAAATAAPSTTAPAAKETPELTTEELGSEASSVPELEQELTEPEDAELEYEGKKFKVPKDLEPELKNALMRHGDYTRKTQEVAEQRKAIQEARTQFEQTAQLHQALISDIGRVQSIDERLQQFQQLNWQQLNAQDPQRAQALLIEFNQLQATRGQMVGSLTQKQQQMQSLRQQEIAKRTDEARAFLMREFKDWSPEKDRALEAYAQREGLDTQALSQFLIANPQIARVLDKAAKWDNSLKQRAAAKRNQEPPPKPVTRVTGAAASNTKLPSEMTPEEYAAARLERKQKRR